MDLTLGLLVCKLLFSLVLWALTLAGELLGLEVFQVFLYGRRHIVMTQGCSQSRNEGYHHECDQDVDSTVLMLV